MHEIARRKSVLLQVFVLYVGFSTSLARNQLHLSADDRDIRSHHIEQAVHGHLEISLEISNDQKLDQNGGKLRDYDVIMDAIKVCLASKSSSEHEWILKSCSEIQNNQVFGGRQSDASMTWQPFDVIRLPLRSENPSTHLVAVKMPHDVTGDYVTYSSALPLMFPNDDVITRITFRASGDATPILSATLSITCSPNRYGPRCGVTCSPPSVRFQCDDVTGELKCADKWRGQNCDNDMLLGNEMASQFIKHRGKRANSWLHLEEFQAGNLERECEEEICDREEAREAFENDMLTEQYWRRYIDPNHCVPNQCYPGHTDRCEDLIGDYTCHCLPGYTGKNCDRQINICQSQPCMNAALCQQHSPTSYICICRSGFRGHTCDININECVESNCGPHGTCIDGINSFTCTCDPGFAGSRCEVDIDECENNPCQNGGNCIDHVAFYRCECPAGYDGERCEDRISPCLSVPCLNNGECVLNPDYTYDCACAPRFTGSRCQHDANNGCASEPCLNGGTCYVTMNNVTDELLPSPTAAADTSFNCVCPIGFRGPTCEEVIDPCEIDSDLCSSNATCVGLGRQFICVCPDGFTGDACQLPGNDSSLERLRCQDNPCMNEARCVFHENETTCVCRPGFNGSQCENEINFCESSPCINEGVCIPAPNNFFCNCAQGFNGTYCEEDVDECSFNMTVCRNDAICNNTRGSFQCICGPYHTGRYCENRFDPCESTPCQNGGSCLHEPQGYMCDCLSGYGGLDCRDVIDPCTDVTNPCVNEVTCTPHSDDATEANCTCTVGFYGRFCAYRRDNCVTRGNQTGNNASEPLLVPISDCGVHGDCVSEDIGFRCVCRPGYEGDRCDTIYTAPMVNCVSENCRCSRSLLDEVRLHGNNESSLNCEYRHYDVGMCRQVTCLTPSCLDDSGVYQCSWNSTCLSKFMNNDLGKKHDDLDCPVIEMTLNNSRLNENMTVEDFCDKIRNLPSFEHYIDDVTVHCSRMNMNGANSSVAVAIDSVTSQRDAAILASEVFQRLEEEFTKDGDEEPNPLADDLDPVFSSIIFMRLGSQIGKVLTSHDDREKPTSSTNVGGPVRDDTSIYIAVPIALLVIAVLLVILLVTRRHRQHKDIQVSYIANPDANRDSVGDESSNDVTSIPTARIDVPESPKKLDKKLKENFVNPIFVEEPTCYALTTRHSVHSNPYVATPYAVSPSSPTFPAQESKSSVERATIDFATPYGQYEPMNGLTLPHDDKFPPANGSETPYAFAKDITPKTPILGKPSLKVGNSPKRGKNNKPNPYEEIDLRRPPIASNPDEIQETVYTMADCRVPSTKSNKSDDSSNYDFATEMPAVGVPAPHSPKLSIKSNASQQNIDLERSGSSSASSSSTPSRGDSGVDVVDTSRSTGNSPSHSVSSSSSTEKTGEHYQSPTTLFPEHDDLFFPMKNAELPEVYAVPRKANPVD